MTRTTWVLGGLAVAGLATSVWLYRDNRRLENALARSQVTATRADPWATGPAAAREGPAPRTVFVPVPQKVTPATSPPAEAPSGPRESRLDRRARRSQEFAAMFGRLDGESEDEYRARVMPMVQMALTRPRQNADEARRIAEEKAGVTTAQHEALDAAFSAVYDDVLNYTNTAISDGQLTPYERNVTGILEYAGGLSGILGDAEKKVGGILSPAQRKSMYESGFEWGEYLGLHAPWEKLNAPPPPRRGDGGS